MNARSQNGDLLGKPALLPDMIIAHKQHHQRPEPVQDSDGELVAMACLLGHFVHRQASRA